MRQQYSCDFRVGGNPFKPKIETENTVIQAMKKPSKRTLIFAGAGILLVLVLALAFRSPPVLVDSAVVKRGAFAVTVEDEGRTRVQDRYQVSAPMTGFMSRVLLEPGDAVERGQPLFVISAAPLEPRSRAQAQASLERAEAALLAAQTQVEAEQARVELAQSELARLQKLIQAGHTSEETLDRAQAEARRAVASLRSTKFAVDVARHEKEAAQAVLANADAGSTQPVTVTAPVNGVILNRARESEGPIQAGEAILTIGNLASLEVEVDLLSPDAVRVSPGMRVELERWGGDEVLQGRVQRVEPAGFLHYSALGVEEQRVWVIVDLVEEREKWEALGDGYRVEAKFILWEGDNVLQVPASALFRESKQWFTYVVKDGVAVNKEVTPARRSGLLVEIDGGLSSGDIVVLHPGEDIAPGSRVELR